MNRYLVAMRRVLTAGLLLVFGSRGNGWADPVLTPLGVSKQFKIIPYASGFTPSSGIGPVGIAFVPGSTINSYKTLVTDYSGNLYSIPHFSTVTSPGPPIASFGANNAFALAQVPNGSSSFRYYLGQLSLGQIIEIGTNGVQIGAPIVSMPGVLAIIPFPPDVSNPPASLAGKLFATDQTNIWIVDPAAKTKTLFAAPGSTADGLAFSVDGKTLYVALNSAGVIQAYNAQPGTGFGTLTWTSPNHPGPDGTAIGNGNLAGYIYVNYNDGSFREFGVASPHLGEDNLIASGGSRGDFIATDTDQPCTAGHPSLMLTQADRIVIIDPPGGGFFGPPTSSVQPQGSIVLPLSSASVPATSTWSLAALVVLLLVVATLALARRTTMTPAD